LSNDFFQAAERISSHIKKCPICQEPFADVNLFMSHLSKCNVSSEEEEDDEDNKDDGDEMVNFELYITDPSVYILF
jgi:hypothetical protein